MLHELAHLSVRSVNSRNEEDGCDGRANRCLGESHVERAKKREENGGEEAETAKNDHGSQEIRDLERGDGAQDHHREKQRHERCDHGCQNGLFISHYSLSRGDSQGTRPLR